MNVPKKAAWSRRRTAMFLKCPRVISAMDRLIDEIAQSRGGPPQTVTDADVIAALRATKFCHWMAPGRSIRAEEDGERCLAFRHEPAELETEGAK